MKKTYESHLMENEVVLWEGKAEPFQLLDRDYKKSLFTSWGIAAAVFIAYLALYIPYAIANELMGKNVIVISVVIGACILCAVFRPFADKNSLEKKTTYVLTNHRAIVCCGVNVKGMFISAETPCKIERLENGADVILMGTAVDSALRKSRSNALTGIIDEEDKSKLGGMIFYSVKDGQKVCDRYAPFKAKK